MSQGGWLTMDSFPVKEGMVVNGYHIGKLLGRGPSNACFLALHQGKEFAVKVIWWSKVQKGSRPGAAATQLATCQYLRQKPYSDHILRVFRYMRTETPDCRFLVTEYCNRGDLRKFTASSPYNGRLDETAASVVLAQVLEGLRTLLAKSIIHRNIKLDSIYIRAKDPLPGGVNFEAVLGDLGSAVNLEIDDIRKEVYYHLHWAPEVFTREYNNKIDIFSLGVSIFEALVGRTPWESYLYVQPQTSIEDKHLYTGRNLYFPVKVPISQGFKDLLKRMTDPNHTTRISWENLYGHPVVIAGQKIAGLAPRLLMLPPQYNFYRVPGMFSQYITADMEIRSYFQMMSSMIALLLRAIKRLSVNNNLSLTEENRLKLGRFFSLMKILLALRGCYISQHLLQLHQGMRCLEGVSSASFHDLKRGKITLQEHIFTLNAQEQKLRACIQEEIRNLDPPKQLTISIVALVNTNAASLDFESANITQTTRTVCHGVVSYWRQYVARQGVLREKVFTKQLADFYTVYNYEEMIKLPTTESDSTHSNFTIEYSLDDSAVEQTFLSFMGRYA